MIRRKVGNVSRYERHCSRFGRVHRMLESHDSVIIRGVPRPFSRGKHILTSYDKQYVTDFVKNLVRGDVVEVSAMWYERVCLHASNQTFIVGEDTKKSIQQYILEAMEHLPESDGVDERNSVFVNVDGDLKLEFLKGGWVSYPISDFGYSSPQEALDDGMLLCDADTDYLWYEEFNEFV